MLKTKTASSSGSVTKLSNTEVRKCADDAFKKTLKTAKNTFIKRLGIALLLLTAMWASDGIGVLDGVQYGMLYMIAENAKKSGRADGNVYMRNGRIRGMAMPSNPQTSYQTEQRANFSTLSSGWNSLTEPQRIAWNGFSIQDTDRFGREVFISGKAAYVALNRNLFNTGDTAISDPPLPVGVPAPSSLSFVADDSSNTILLTFDPTPVPANYTWLVYATPMQSPGTFAPSASKYRLIAALTAGTATGEDIHAAYLARFGAILTGQKIFVKIVAVSTTSGIASAPIVASSIVVA